MRNEEKDAKMDFPSPNQTDRSITTLGKAIGLDSAHRVLVVDDEVDITSVLKVALEGRGVTADTYNDPMVALSMFKPNIYSIAILDIRMPGMNGFELCRLMKKVDPRLSVFFLTAFDVYSREFDKMFPD